jgi:ribosome biogenesis GTPase
MANNRYQDEDDFKSRPTRSGSRPRSKDRPEYKNTTPGFVTAVDRGRFTVMVNEGEENETLVYAVKARDIGRKGVLVGDKVQMQGDTTGNPDALARIVTVTERTSLLRRSADDVDDSERAIVANADQVLIVQALADPTPRIRFIDRCVVAALAEGIKPIVVLTKADLADDKEIREQLDGLDIQIFTVQQQMDLTEIKKALHNKVSVAIGHSGVGKSTLVNGLAPLAHRPTGDVNDVTGRGRHTSTQAVAIHLPEGGWIIDTPGVRSFGLAHIKAEDLINFFPELEEGTDDCPRACSHNEAACALDAYVEQEKLNPSRLDSLRRLITSLSAPE